MVRVKSKIKITQAVIVEGLHDKALLENVIDGVIIHVNGFGIYKDKAKLELIRRYAESTGIILLTDSDDAGKQIRHFLKSKFPKDSITDVYVPNLFEVEDVDVEILRTVFEGIASKQDEPQPKTNEIYSRQWLFDEGLIGGVNSSKKRKELLREMNLPENLSVTDLLDVLNRYGNERLAL